MRRRLPLELLVCHDALTRADVLEDLARTNRSPCSRNRRCGDRIGSDLSVLRCAVLRCTATTSKVRADLQSSCTSVKRHVSRVYVYDEHILSAERFQLI